MLRLNVRTIRDTTVLWALDNTSDVVARKGKKDSTRQRTLFEITLPLNSKLQIITKKKPSSSDLQTIYSLQRFSRLVLLNGRIVLLVKHKDTMVADGGQSGVDCAHFGCAGSVSPTIFEIELAHLNHFFPIFANRSHLVAHRRLRATKTRSKLPHSHFRPKGVCSPMYTRLFTSYGPSQYLSSFPNWRQKSKKISFSLISVAARKKLWWPIASSISANSWAYRSSQSQETQIPCSLNRLF